MDHPVGILMYKYQNSNFEYNVILLYLWQIQYFTVLHKFIFVQLSQFENNKFVIFENSKLSTLLLQIILSTLLHITNLLFSFYEFHILHLKFILVVAFNSIIYTHKRFCNRLKCSNFAYLIDRCLDGGLTVKNKLKNKRNLVLEIFFFCYFFCRSKDIQTSICHVNLHLYKKRNKS